ncbi:HDOD domain-containing protein [Oleidesulfovibrio sp.]|uniref:HDOD domain-containing protein n=1 Tax=Oleidesulfovibrio sp. TaxID=2909707 RepID=UPI003A85E987
MGKLNVDDLKTGMVLAEDVMGRDGRRLLGAGAELEERHLRIFKAWGVTEADIEGVDRSDMEQELEAELPLEVLEAARARIEQHMHSHSDSELEHELRRIATLRLSHTILRNELAAAPDFGLEALREAAEKDDYNKEVSTVHSVVDDQVQLLSFPDIYFRIVKVLESPSSSSRKLAEVVSTDSSLTARLLRLVNSPFYGFPSKIDSISRAITLIGANELVTLVLGISVMKVFAGVPAGSFNMRSFWEHSILTGVFARLIAGHKMGLSEERLFVGGLLHDLGALLMVSRHPHTMCRTLVYACEQEVPLYKAEKAVFGFDHAAAGSLLMNRWKLPDGLVRMVGYHHAPDRARAPIDAAVIHLADILSFLYRIEDVPTGLILPALNEAGMDKLGLAPSTIETMMTQAERQFEAIVAVFFEE